MEAIFADIRYGLRWLLKRPSFTAIALLTLAVGIGVNTAIFSVVNAVMLRPLPYDNPGQLVRLWSDRLGQRTEQNEFSPAEITEFRDQLTTFEDVGLFDFGLSANLTGGTQPERVNASEASPGLFDLLRVKPVIGRTFLPDEVEVQQNRVALFSEGLWKRRFGADPNFAGKTVQLDGETFTVVGVLPESFKFPEKVDVWLPFSFTAADWQNDRQHYYVHAVGRLKPGVTLDQAKADLETIMQRLSPSFSAERKKWGVTLIPMHEQEVGKVGTTLWILLGAVGLVLLIACVNVANLMLTRTADRRKELAIRVALGAGRSRVIRQLLFESLLLALIGGGAGIFLAVWLTRLFSTTLVETLPRGEEVGVDGRVLLFTLAVSILTAFVFGLAPALAGSNPNLNETLKEGGRRSASGSRRSVRDFLVVSEIALSLVLLVGAGLLVKSFLRLQSVNVGFDARNVLTMEVTLPRLKYPQTSDQNAFVQQAIQRIEALPGVKSVAATVNLPLVGTWGMGYSVPGHANQPFQIADNANVTPNYFGTMGIALRQGRDFSDHDTTKGAPVIIINEAFVRKHFANENPIGQIINAGQKRVVVGVVGDTRPRGLDLETKPQLYLPYAQKPTIAPFLTFTIRTETEPLSVAAVAQREIQTLDRDLPVANVRSMDQIVSTSLEQRRLTMGLFSGFAAIALLLAAIGVYGVVSYSVTQRTHELGIRVALGARWSDLLRLILKQGVTLASIGVVIGVGAGLALTRLIKSLLFQVGTNDFTTFALVAGGLVVVVMLACYVPARRATRVDPLETLRAE
ncbi:MAG TPA: ABC transporter permease [Pyrinomonadaceae bacterium]|jgi:putative ABC transport system permease protein|nr:ABC transporter permease [Pyrinomonadaceae bacterium]